MALTFSNPSQSGERHTGAYQMGGGLTLRVLDCTVGNADVDFPAAGADLQAQATKMGFHRIVHVLDASVRTGATPPVYKGLKHIWYPNTGKLSFVEDVTATLNEQDADSDIVDTDIIRLVVIGV